MMKNFWFKANKRNTFITSLFESWHRVLRNYEKNAVSMPYAYIERTNVGLLSAAALKIHAYPLEEYSVTKGKGAYKYKGRADLWLQASNERTYNFEAKQDWISFDSKKVTSKVNNVLKLAKNDLKKRTDYADISIAIAFVAPYILATKEINLNGFKKQLLNLKTHNGDFAALHFCDEKIWREFINKDGYYYPGIGVVGKYL